MKKHLLLSFLIVCGYLYPQSSLFSNNSPTDVVKLDPKGQKFEYVPGVILVKLNDDAVVGLSKRNGFSFIGISSVDLILQKYKTASAEKLFPNAEKLLQKQIFKSYNGQSFVCPNLHNIYKLQIANDQQLFQAIDELKQDSNVVYAEPNYILSIVNSEPLSPPLNETEMLQWLKENPNAIPKTNKGKNTNSPLIITPNDPLYSQQWGMPACQVDAVWDSTTGDTTQIIAILDTGVDWTHPDLAANIWANPNPRNTPDADGVVNDIRGWDYINNDNDPSDDNSHGTHVAGIAAAVGNNGIGIAGVNWHAKIMPIKVFQSSGRGDAATITKGIIYATTHGATVINMSFGSYARSYTMEAALENAYSTCVLVAAAGNDNLNLNDDVPIVHPTIFYPAGLSYVVGVQATQNSLNLYSATLFKRGTYLSDFTNYDDNGPIFSPFIELQNYEVQAPGVSILSTIPNGNYRIFNGTSMAAPIVSGAISLYKSIINNESQEVLWAKLIRSSGTNINLYNAIHSTLSPKLALVTSAIVDTLAGDDKDGRVDAGETIQLWFKIRNTGGQTDSAFVGLKFGEFEDTTTAQILIPQVMVGSISTYASRTNELSPLKIHISPSVVNGRNITFQAYIGYKNSSDTVFQDIQVTVENGQQLEGVMDSTFVLTPDKLWFVNGSFRVGANGTLIIKPGTHLVIGNQVTIRGSLIANGTKDSLIVITSSAPSTWNTSSVFNFETSNVIFNYVYFYNLNSPLGVSGPISATNCIFDESQYTIGNSISTFTNNLIKNSQIYQFWNYSPSLSKSNVFYNNYVVDRTWMPAICMYNTYYKNINTYYSAMYPSALISSGGVDTNLFKNNSFINSIGYCNSFVTNGSQERLNLGKQYWGSTVPQTIRKQIYDFYKNSSLPLAVFEPMLTSPPDSCHGLVWKVMINGKDAQDEIVDPVGVGAQRFDVYFNREMNPSYIPQLSFGVRSPFTQQGVTDSAHWSSDHKIWTAYKTVQLYTGDGINIARVAGARDLEGWEIPVEDMRFQFLINAAGSSSNGFNATAGLGKVALDWESPTGLPDLLGYNLYRFNNITDSTFNAPILINKTLVADTLYTDYSVIPNKKYYYYYKVVRTDFSESDSSKVISSIPFTAAFGDANGDLSVSVLDVLTDVSYILGQNPQPFIFDAADVVRDSSINVLDVVGTVNIVLHGSLKKYIAKETYGNAKLELVGNTLKLNTDIPLAGIQVRLKGLGMNNIQFVGQGMTGFEIVSGNKGDTLKTIIYYNMNNTELQPGSYVLGTLQGVQSAVYLTEAVLADKNGNNVLTNVIDNGKSLIPTEYYLDQNFPNPFNMQTIIQYGVPQKTVGRMVIYNILGQKIKTFELGEINAGRYRIQWDGRNNFGKIVSSGVYIYRFESQKFTLAKKLLLLK